MERSTRRPRLDLPQTRMEFAASWLRESILSGDLTPGERLPLTAIAEQLEMSLIPVREALRTLASEGLVVPLPHRGYLVQPLTVEDVDNSYELRILLEPLAVRRAVPKLDDADFARLRIELDEMSRAFREDDWLAYRVHHRAFHFVLYAKSESPWLVRFAEMLWVNTQRYQRLTTRIAGQLQARNREHEAILRACEARDAEKASKLMREHLSRAAAKIRNLLEGNEDLLGVG